MAKRAPKPPAAATKDRLQGDESGGTAVQEAPEPRTDDRGDQGDQGGPGVDEGEDLPDIGDQVLYYDRDEVVRAFEEAERTEEFGPKPRPFAAIVTGTETLEGERFLQLAVFHPSEGLQVKRHVRYDEKPDANCCTRRPPTKVPFRAVVPMQMLVEATKIAIRQLITEGGVGALDVRGGDADETPPGPREPGTNSPAVTATEGVKDTDAQT